MFNNLFIFENLAIYEIMWKGRVKQGTDENMAHTHCMLDN
jgi:hypothetical protein